MRSDNPTLILKNAHVIDPSQNLEGVMDVAIRDNKIAEIGQCEAGDSDRVLDLTGQYLSPGWIDIHVHVYGTLGFAEPDSLGIYQGVTTFIEAGGPGIGTLDQFMALLKGQTKTDLYIGPYLRPIGLIGLNYVEGDVRSYGSIPIDAWLDFAAQNPDVIRYLKVGAFEKGGRAPLHLAKGVADLVGVPMYIHIGELQPGEDDTASYDAFRVAEAGDIITHLYNGNIGGILDKDSNVVPEVRQAQERGVLFDIGFGGYNFSWRVAEQAYSQGILPDIISSDLQQFNVCGPVFSLAHVLGFFTHLGMGLSDVIRRVTSTPADALGLLGRAGSLRIGMPADITVFKVEAGEFELLDTVQMKRTTKSRIVPTMVFKEGQGYDCDLQRCQDERNWFPVVLEDRMPEAARRLSKAQFEFLHSLLRRLSTIEWEVPAPGTVDLDKAEELQGVFHEVRMSLPISLHDALKAVYDCFIEEPFTVQISLFLLRMERSFALGRIEEVTAMGKVAA